MSGRYFTSKRPTDSITQMWYNLKNLQQSPIKNAVYNLVIVAVIASTVTVCLVLGPFLKPLIWALLIGAVLFPFKYRMSASLRGWFTRLENEDTSLVVGVVLCPFETLEAFGKYLGEWLRGHYKILLTGVVGFSTLRVMYLYAPKGFFCMLWRNFRWGHELFAKALSSLDYKIVIAILLIYLTLVVFFWKYENSIKFMIAGQTLWIVTTAYVCSFLGAFQVTAFLLILTYSGCGVIYDLKARSGANNQEGASWLEKFTSLLDVHAFFCTNNMSTRPSFQSFTSTPVAPDETPKTKIDLNVKSMADIRPDTLKKSQSEIYFKMLFFSCIATVMYQHVYLSVGALIPIAYHVTHLLITHFGIKNFVYQKIDVLTEDVKVWILARHSAILPLCLPGIVRLTRKINITVRAYLKSSVDVFSSIIMIILLICTVIFAGVFFAVQIYSETIAVVELGNDVVNWTESHRPELMEMFPDMSKSMENVIENAYQYGRTGIETYLDDLLKDADPGQAKKLKIQVLNIWDRCIQHWLDMHHDNFEGPRVTKEAIADSFGHIVEDPVAQQGILGWAKSNIGTLLEVVDSLWIIFKKNLNILSSLIWTIISMLLGGGHAVIQFLVNAIVFFTALFYLLNSSEERYAPLAAANCLGFSYGPRIADAIEASVSGVIIATMKLAIFHGLFTWLTHTVFGARVVFLPSVFAALLAAAPFLGTYWISIPAFLDLWLIQDHFYWGLVLFLLHFIIPSSLVDSAIHADIDGGGHPYLTGLSIAGGMYWLGWEGAIFGPILFCLLVVIYDITAIALKESPTTPHVMKTPGCDTHSPDRRHSSYQNKF